MGDRGTWQRLYWGDELGVSRHKQEIYSWLRLHFRWVGSVVEGKGHWSLVTESMAKDGVKGIRGSVPYVESVKCVWDLVERDLTAHTLVVVNEIHVLGDDAGRGFKLVH